MPYQTLQVHVVNHVAVITLNRPEVRNAFNDTMLAELTAVFIAFGQDAQVRAIRLTANGSAFCAGADLGWMKRMADVSMEENLADAVRLADMLLAVYRCPKPVVATIQGDCYGGGVGLVAACDIAVAAESARFCLSEVRLGLIPATIAPYVIRAIGERAAHRYVLTAERIPAAEAQRLGLVHAAVATDTLERETQRLLDALVLAGPQALSAAKRLIDDVAGAPLNDALLAETVERIAQARASEEGREGVRAFLEKRKPNWLS